MKQFKFKLETLLKVRKQEEEASHKIFITATEELDAIIQKIKSLQGEYEQQLEELQHKKKQGVNIDSYCHYYNYLEKINHEILNRQDDMLRAQNNVAEKRIRFMQFRKKVKVLENLKEKQHHRWESQLQKAEAGTLDEIATIRHSKLQREEKADAE